MRVPPRLSHGHPILLALLLALPLSCTKSASAPAAVGAQRVQPARLAGPIVPVVTPRALDRSRRVKVFVKMVGDPVAAVRAQAPGKLLSESQHRAVEEGLRASQDAFESRITARGGRVLARYRDAYNGLKVEIASGEIAALRAMPEVASVQPVRVHRLENAVGVPFIGAPAAWAGVPGFRGEGVRIAVIDTGIDYTHANFGGPGTAAAFTAASAASTSLADPALFGPDAPKVKGGIDLVGDDYDPEDPAHNIPQPDPNPLDCNGQNLGHGSHVAGTAAGLGVTLAGETFRGPYDETTPTLPFRIGPGVAPAADLYAVRVFGCQGATDVVVDAIDWAVHNDMQVINMSLGSPFGSPDDPEVEATDNAVRAGVVVVTSAGNEGFIPYITGVPGAAASAISTAAVDSTAQFPGAKLALSAGATITALNANGAQFADGASPAVIVLRNASGTVSLGCSEAEYVDALIAGKLVVTVRGSCDRVARAIFGAKHGAAAVAMINNGAGYPPLEGEIPGVAIPFLGVRQSDGPALAAATSAGLANAVIPNPGFRLFAGFSSEGPRSGDSLLKPDVAAPGVAVFSTQVGTGNLGFRLSGTSMASPHVAGTAALAVQAHPRWSAEEIRAAIVNTADAAQVLNYQGRLGGAGLVQPALAVQTQAIAFARGEDDEKEGARLSGLSFGFAELRSDFVGRRTLVVRNKGRTPLAFQVTAAPTAGVPHTVDLGRSSIRVPPGAGQEIPVTLRVPAATVGDTSAFHEVAGLVTLTPAAGANGGVALRVPYYLVPRARSDVSATLRGRLSPAHPSAAVTVRNSRGSPLAGTADFYAWGLFSPPQQLGGVDLRAVGVESLPHPDAAGADRLLFFAVSTWQRWSNAVANEYDLLVDVNGDGNPDFDVVGIDLGLVLSGSFSGEFVSLVVDLATGIVVGGFDAIAPTDNSTLLLPALASDMALSAANPRFAYAALAFDGSTGAVDVMPGLDAASGLLVEGAASFNAWTSSVSQGDLETLAAGASVTVPVSIDPAEWALTPARGLMVVNIDDSNGREQAELIALPR